MDVTIAGQTVTISQSGTGGTTALVMTSQTWTHYLYNDVWYGNSNGVVTCTATGPIGSTMWSYPNYAVNCDSWYQNQRQSGDPATTTWTTTWTNVDPTIAFYVLLRIPNGVTQTDTYVYPHP